MLDVLVAQIVLQRSRIPSRVRLVESTGVPEHVRVRFDFEPAGLASSVNELLKVAHGHRRATLGHKQERRLALTVQATQRAQLPAGQRVDGRRPVLYAVDRHRCGLKIDLRPLQVAQFGGSQPVPEGQQDHGLIPVRPTVVFAPLDQLLDLAFGQVFAGAHVGVFGSARRDFPYLVVEDTTRKAVFIMVCRAPLCSSFRTVAQ